MEPIYKQQKNNKLLWVMLVISVFLLTTSNSIAGLGIWTSQGPDGGKIIDLTTDPVVANTVYASTRGGVYKSLDGGSTWHKMNNGITIDYISRIIHHPTLSGTLYVLGNQTVFKTTDGGANWHLSNTGLPTANEVFYDLEISPSNSNILYLGTLNGVFKSIDAGASWSPSNLGLVSLIYDITVSPTDDNRIYVSASANISAGGLFESTDAGLTWLDVSAAIPAPYNMGEQVNKVTYAGTAGEIYISTSNGENIFKSNDNGVTWIHQNNVKGRKISVNPSTITEVFVSDTVGLWKSTDGGTNWNHILADFAGNTTEVSNSTALVFDSFNPAKKYAGTTSNGIYIQTNPNPSWSPSVTNMNAESIRALAVATYPDSSSRLFAGIGDVFTPALVSFISDDKGLSWSQNNSGLKANSLREIEVDPFTATDVASTHIYAVGYGAAYSLDFLGNPTDGDGGIYKSTDGGSTWLTIDNGIPLNVGPPVSTLFGTVRDISLDLSSSILGGPIQTLYVAGSGRFQDDGMGSVTTAAARIYKSTDAGATWIASDTGFDFPTSAFGIFPAAVKIEIDPTNSMTLYASTFLARYNGVGPVPTLDNGVYKSTNAGATWVLSSDGIPTVGGVGTSNYNVLSLVIDPTIPTRLYASVHNPQTFESQIYKSEDSANTWTLANAGIATSDVRDILVASNGDVYAAAAGNSGNPGGVYRSQDHGLTWQSMSIGFDSLTAAIQLTIDETGVNPILYSGSHQSVQSLEIIPDGDTDGVADATEASAPNNGDANMDGTADNNQNNVSSLPSNPIDVGATKSTNGGINFATVEVIPVAGNCSILEDVQSLTNSTIPDDAHRSFDYGVLRFDIVDCTQATVEITFHGASNFTNPDWSMRIYAPAVSGTTEFSWQNFNASATGNKWTLNLIDGQFGDIRPTNGRILFQGGPGNFKNTLFNDGFE